LESGPICINRPDFSLSVSMFHSDSTQWTDAFGEVDDHRGHGNVVKLDNIQFVGTFDSDRYENAVWKISEHVPLGNFKYIVYQLIGNMADCSCLTSNDGKYGWDSITRE